MKQCRNADKVSVRNVVTTKLNLCDSIIWTSGFLYTRKPQNFAWFPFWFSLQYLPEILRGRHHNQHCCFLCGCCAFASFLTDWIYLYSLFFASFLYCSTIYTLFLKFIWRHCGAMLTCRDSQNPLRRGPHFLQHLHLDVSSLFAFVNLWVCVFAHRNTHFCVWQRNCLVREEEGRWGQKRTVSSALRHIRHCSHSNRWPRENFEVSSEKESQQTCSQESQSHPRPFQHNSTTIKVKT